MLYEPASSYFIKALPALNNSTVVLREEQFVCVTGSWEATHLVFVNIIGSLFQKF